MWAVILLKRNAPVVNCGSGKHMMMTCVTAMKRLLLLLLLLLFIVIQLNVM